MTTRGALAAGQSVLLRAGDGLAVGPYKMLLEPGTDSGAVPARPAPQRALAADPGNCPMDGDGAQALDHLLGSPGPAASASVTVWIGVPKSTSRASFSGLQTSGSEFATNGHALSGGYRLPDSGSADDGAAAIGRLLGDTQIGPSAAPRPPPLEVFVGQPPQDEGATQRRGRGSTDRAEVEAPAASEGDRARNEPDVWATLAAAVEAQRQGSAAMTSGGPLPPAIVDPQRLEGVTVRPGAPAAGVDHPSLASRRSDSRRVGSSDSSADRGIDALRDSGEMSSPEIGAFSRGLGIRWSAATGTDDWERLGATLGAVLEEGWRAAAGNRLGPALREARLQWPGSWPTEISQPLPPLGDVLERVLASDDGADELAAALRTAANQSAALDRAALHAMRRSVEAIATLFSPAKLLATLDARVASARSAPVREDPLWRAYCEHFDAQYPDGAALDRMLVEYFVDAYQREIERLRSDEGSQHNDT